MVYNIFQQQTETGKASCGRISGAKGESAISKRMPVLFIGHGSPMNALENNTYTENWKRVGREIPRPKAILAVSAHWYTDGTRVTDAEKPKMVYDMYGFPPELYKIDYPAPGAPELARRTAEIIGPSVRIDNSWGLDHGAWSVLVHLFPRADIPVFQLSVNGRAPAAEHFAIGRKIAALRGEGVLILGSGNVVHNLARLDWGKRGGFAWAEEFDGFIRDKIRSRSYEDVIDYRRTGECAELSFSTPDHFYPLLSVLGASEESDVLTVFNDSCVMGALSMTCYLFQEKIPVEPEHQRKGN
ncbi:MAG TPA: 4,5-DOPA dioxygenase extradiol [Ruminococcaceae bacterium]|jgi:4,5-DOPA dioxygenase extradiol|nr:4,5-DOPA dioxygenase extradiol [Oscillospiraceae bacterium]